MEITRIIDHRLYPRKAISEARAAYKDYCSFSVAPLHGDQAQLTIIVSPKYAGNGREVLLSFLNYALDKAAELQLESD